MLGADVLEVVEATHDHFATRGGAVVLEHLEQCLEKQIEIGIGEAGLLGELVFLTNNVTWSAQTIADLYRCRWSIEVFFKELKQTLQLADFLGHNANAVKWQVWTALLAYVLLRFCAHLGQWSHSFTRLFALIRSALWQNWELRSLLEVYGTAGGGGRFLGTPQQAYLAGFG